MVINDLLPGAPFFFWLFSFLAVVELSQFQILVEWNKKSSKNRQTESSISQ